MSSGPEQEAASAREAGPVAWKEGALSCALALLLALWPAAEALFGGDAALMAVDCATVQLPWSADLAAGRAPRNPDLSDQAVQFYPFYRWVARSWLAGDAPYWCPLIYIGVPGLANAQCGAVDPQVLLLVLFEALGGQALFDWGLGLLVWLRIAAALWGAYLLARRLGLGSPGASLAAIAFGYSGYLVLWLNHPHGHVTPFFPWVLYFLEGIRRSRPLAAMAGAATALAFAILGGHPETAFCIGATAGFWALAMLVQDRAAGGRALAALALGTSAGAVLLLPFLEYMELSGTKYLREIQVVQARGAVDWISLGLLAGLGAVVLAFRRARASRDWLPVGAVSLAFVGTILLLAQRGLGEGALFSLVPDLHGRPGVGAGYRGEGAFNEPASPWIAFAALAFALAGLLDSKGRLRRRGLVTLLGCLGYCLSVEAAGVLELFRFVPLVGLGETVRFSPVGALLLGLLAGDAVESSPLRARAAAFLVLLAFVGIAYRGGDVAPLSPDVPRDAEQDELVGFALLPSSVIEDEHSSVEGWIAPAVEIERGRLVIQRVDVGGAPVGPPRPTIGLELAGAPSELARASAPGAVEAAPRGARWFRTGFARTGDLPEGHWRFTVELLSGDRVVGSRLAGVSTIERSVDRAPLTMLFLAGGLLALLVPRRFAPVAILLAAGQALHFARGVNPTVPREEVFPLTRTEEILREGLGSHRFFGDSGVLPPNTGLVHGVRALDGYDAMEVLAFSSYRISVVPPGVAPVLAWNARGIDLLDNGFRLCGVGMLALRGPFEHPGWELVAGPSEPDAKRAETWIYRARDPLPRAFCVPRVTTVEELGRIHRADPRGWDPLAVAAVDGDWRPERPFTRAEVGELELTNNEARVTAELDGDGLLVVTEQAFPGWKAYVDGEERAVLTVDMVFRGVALDAGRHEVVFRYEPVPLRNGAWITLLSFGGIAALAVLGLRRVRAGAPARLP